MAEQEENVQCTGTATDDVPTEDLQTEMEPETTTGEMPSSVIEKLEEAKLKAKFPMAAGRPMSGHSVFLQKRLANRQKYFDSGDYQMAKQKSALKTRQNPPGLTYATGEAIPTPDTVPVRKSSIIQPCKFTSNSTA